MQSRQRVGKGRHVASKSTQLLIEKLHQEGMQEGMRKKETEYSGIQSQCLISTLEQRFSGIPDSLKDSIRKVTDAKRLYNLAGCAFTAKTIEEFARQLAM